jgi:hypothetical protein
MIRGIGKISTSSDNGAVQPQTQQEREWWAEFDAAAKRPLAERWKYAFIKTYKPVMDDAPYRSFETTKLYREWCAANLPEWLGYGGI